MRMRITGGLVAIAAVTALVAAAASAAPIPPPAPTAAVATAPPAAMRSLETELPVALNDTIVPVFATSADTVFTIVSVASPTGIRSALRTMKCGHTKIFLRVYAYGSRKAFGKMLKADTLPIVSCKELEIPSTPVASVASVTVCVNADTLAFNALHVQGDTTVDPAKIPCLATSPLDSAKTTQAIAIARDSLGNVLTGRHITWEIIDQVPAPAPPGASLRHARAESFSPTGKHRFDAYIEHRMPKAVGDAIIARAQSQR